MSLQVPLAPVPDAAVLAGKDVLWKAEENQRRGGESPLQPENHEGWGFGQSNPAEEQMPEAWTSAPRIPRSWHPGL